MRYKNKKNILTVCIVLITACVFGAFFFSLVLPSDSTTPIRIKQKAQTIVSFSGHDRTPFISNQWYSSVFNHFPSSPLYAMPIAYKVTPKGLGFSYPLIKKTKNTIFAPYTEDFSVGFARELKKPEITAIGDWTIGMKMKNNTNALSFTIGHGIPYTIFSISGENTKISITHNFSININGSPLKNSDIKTDAFILSTNDNYYYISFPAKTAIHIDTDAIVIPQTTKLFVGLLDKKENTALFKNIRASEITDSSISIKVDSDKITATYQVVTPQGTVALMGLYPHQYDNLTERTTVIGTYQTLRGEIKILRTNTFDNEIPLIVPSGTMSKLANDHPDISKQIKQDISDIITNKKPNSNDYFLGTWFGKVTNLLLLADVYNLDGEKKKLLQFVEPIFQKSLSGFVYDKQKTSIIAMKPEFGNEKLNDHHFHYGYYLRTAAVISNFDLSFLPKIKKQIDSLASDIANIDKTSTEYPFLRNFDIYESHSLADGEGATEDGNNQESTSEAINAWYGVYLWAKVINDTMLQKYALFLYNSEIIGAKYYWFDIKNIYTSPYAHAIATIVWGGKVDFATWFSDKTNMKYGIELLPFTPASGYLGKLEFQKYADDFAANGGNQTESWGDLFVMWKSFYAPDQAIALKDKVTKQEDNTSRAMFLYMLYSNSEQYRVTPAPSPLPKK